MYLSAQQECGEVTDEEGVFLDTVLSSFLIWVTGVSQLAALVHFCFTVKFCFSCRKDGGTKVHLSPRNSASGWRHRIPELNLINSDS